MPRLIMPPMVDEVTVASLHLYPVKGCRAVDVDALTFSADGLIVGDRAAMIVDARTGAFISQRHVPTLARFRARLIDGHQVELGWPGMTDFIAVRSAAPSTIRVTVWDDTFDADDGGEAVAAWLSDALQRPVRLVWLRDDGGRLIDPFWAGAERRPTSFADLGPILLTNVASLDDLNARRVAAGMAPIEMARFRPNVVVRGLDAFGEDGVAALRDVDGGVTLALIKPCARCSVIELDPTGGEKNGDEVLRSLASWRTLANRRGTRGVLFGQNAVATTGSGTSRLAVGDRLMVARRPA